ncbi:MAG: sigma-54-dependent Fis family transcriptional regulator [Cryobacterium sp.]|nr:sigma-54-dependent Fis family transcriptional regulator [Oligoflexia bacterium]
MSRHVLIIDDEASIRSSLEGALKDEGYRVRSAASGRDGIDLLRAESVDVVVLDIWMPDLDGLETLKQIKAEFPDQPVIMMSGHGTIDTAVRATKLGAFDFLEKPPSLERMLVLLQNAASVRDLARENQALRKQINRSRTLMGRSAPLLQIQALIRQVAPTTGSVLITGENGTGKELVAHSIHALSSRYTRTFVEVNCAAIPEELIESELFGHEKGAFTGATQLRRGKFDLAHEGTLFLDEIGDMSMKTQAKILRILQEQKFERVGGTQTISVDVRIVAATNKDLRAEIARGNFREDLFYRLNVIPFHVPPLRDRQDDIPLLAEHFLKEFSVTHGKRLRSLSEEAKELLKSYSWPGNVRELKNLIERMMILTLEVEEGLPITANHLFSHLESDALSAQISNRSEGSQASPSTHSSPGSARNLRDARSEFERDFILKTLKENDWNVSKAATILGIERSHLHKKMKSYGIESDPKD